MNRKLLSKVFRQRFFSSTSQVKSMRESLEDIKPYGQTLLFVGSAIVGIIGVSRYISKLEDKIANLEKITDIKLDKMEETTNTKFSKLESTTDAKIKTAKAEAETVSTRNYLKFSKSLDYTSLHPKAYPNSSPSDGSSTNP